jgi:hypothetical protein
MVWLADWLADWLAGWLTAQYHADLIAVAVQQFGILRGSCAVFLFRDSEHNIQILEIRRRK